MCAREGLWFESTCFREQNSNNGEKFGLAAGAVLKAEGASGRGVRLLFSPPGARCFSGSVRLRSAKAGAGGRSYGR